MYSIIVSMFYAVGANLLRHHHFVGILSSSLLYLVYLPSLPHNIPKVTPGLAERLHFEQAQVAHRQTRSSYSFLTIEHGRIMQ